MSLTKSKDSKFYLRLQYVLRADNQPDLLPNPKPTSHFVNTNFCTKGSKLLKNTNGMIYSGFNLEKTLEQLNNDKVKKNQKKN